MNVIDAHQHFWQYNPQRDSWIDDTMKILKKDFLPVHLKPLLEQNGVNGCVAVQADQSEDETKFLVNLARTNEFVKGVVGWVDLLAEDVEARLSHFTEDPFFKGIRHIVQAEPEGFMLRKDFQNGISKLERYGLTYDILVYPDQLPDAIQLVSTFDSQPFVLDHLAKPCIKEGIDPRWKKRISELAGFPNVFCKLSGMVTEAVWKQWSINDFEPYVECIFECFGVDRILFGSDWPVCLLSGSYNEVVAITDFYSRFLSESEKAKIMGENAIRFYSLKM